VAVTKDVRDDAGNLLGKTVTIYAHVDLDLDEAAGLSIDGKAVRKGDVISRHLYAGTRGGPHLHFEIRYYRPRDEGTETFYGPRFPGRDGSDLTDKSTGSWSLGYWNPNVGYGFGDPRNHGISCY
jgi:murein DD-endopeptidase MepM/ murein hydrolase activator NlpD